MTRRESRQTAFQIIFSQSINDTDVETAIESVEEFDLSKPDEFCDALVRTTIKHISEIDGMLIPNLKGWDITRISKVSLAILRISCAQLYFSDEIDPELKSQEKIIINEAVLISKAFSNDEDYIFINGVLGRLVRSEQQEV
ncbi:MAG: transcription antitermination factor NusB [Oscillospiraceae bacterium]|nr:transcription antitermination factor NusB [Oscillospiraceae bacterium]